MQSNFLPIDKLALQTNTIHTYYRKYKLHVEVLDIHCILLSKNVQIVMVKLHYGPTADRHIYLFCLIMATAHEYILQTCSASHPQRWLQNTKTNETRLFMAKLTLYLHFIYLHL